MLRSSESSALVNRVCVGSSPISGDVNTINKTTKLTRRHIDQVLCVPLHQAITPVNPIKDIFIIKTINVRHYMKCLTSYKT